MTCSEILIEQKSEPCFSDTLHFCCFPQPPTLNLGLSNRKNTMLPIGPAGAQERSAAPWQPLVQLLLVVAVLGPGLLLTFQVLGFCPLHPLPSSPATLVACTFRAHPDLTSHNHAVTLIWCKPPSILHAETRSPWLPFSS